ncbi:glycoside hydrolase family 128 protein [Trichocladium antarcticum]|uniref:Glycoside hydrolase family 128 protein n=1 Tax=Trichocladium antarcticum TaxID=1450529 RepID=A0AAN6UM55_9PEZI|nr:glycoside hydrolase family 128 protein [Trichocladium antarcticum]
MHSIALVALAALSLGLGQVVAAGHRQDGHRHLRHKKAIVTELVTVTNWVTVTLTERETSTSASARVFVTQSRKPKPEPSSENIESPAAVPTTLVPQVKPAVPTPEPSTQAPAVNSPAPVVNSPAPVVNTPPPAVPTPVVQQPAPASPSVAASGSNGNSGGGSSGGSAKRGLAYNNPTFLSRFISSGTQVSWAYNWGQYDDSNTDLEFCPMLWGLKLDFAETWPKNAQKALDAGSKCLLSFNEPDLDSQANMSPQLAAQKHRELMNPFAGKAKIGSPAITNSGSAGQGIDWMKQWFAACGGHCAVDFVNIHIYGVDTNTFLRHLREVDAAFKKPVWITEFAFGGSDDEINSQLATVVDQIEGNSTYSFVERYSYFMVDQGMVKGDSLSTYGHTFAFGA